MVTPGCKHGAGGARLKKGYRVRMALLAGISVGDWDRLEVPEGYRAEVIAGELVVSPSAPPRHGAAQAVLTALLVAAVPPGLVVLVDTEWQVAQSGLVAAAPRPDILVVEAAAIADDTRFTSTPVLAVEILSQSDFHVLEPAGRPRIEAKRGRSRQERPRPLPRSPDDPGQGGPRGPVRTVSGTARRRCHRHGRLGPRSGRTIPIPDPAASAAALLSALVGEGWTCQASEPVPRNKRRWP